MRTLIIDLSEFQKMGCRSEAEAGVREQKSSRLAWAASNSKIQRQSDDPKGKHLPNKPDGLCSDPVTHMKS